jgi:hypothetical protein
MMASPDGSGILFPFFLKKKKIEQTAGKATKI